MKKLLIAISVLLLVFCGCIIVSAESDLTINNLQFSLEDYVISVGGECSSHPYCKVVMEIVRPGGDSESKDDICGIDMTSANGSGSFSFEAVLPETNGEYLIRVSNYYSDVVEKNVYIADEATVTSYMKNASSVSELQERSYSCSVVLGIDTDALEKIKNKENVFRIFYNDKASFKDAKSINEYYFKALMAVSVSESESAGDAENIIEKYIGYMGIADTELYKNYKSAGYSFGEKLLNKSWSSYGSFVEEVGEALLLSAIKNSPGYTKINGYLSEAEKLTSNIELDGYNAASSSVKSTVDRNINRKDYQDINALNKAINEILKSASTQNSGGSGSGSGGGGSSYGISSKPTSSMTIKGDNIEDALSNGNNKNVFNELFSDMDKAEWAKNSVQKLVYKKIINGYEDGTFRPENIVKREEFIKMTAIAFDIPESELKPSWNDADSSGWYYPYLCNAYEFGIVKGYSDGRIGIGSSVSRQDAAVILYRIAVAKGLSFNKSDNVFIDDGDISSYASDAVCSLAGSGIISGVGNNTFAPLKTCTRAEAAVLVNGIMEYLEGKGVK